jgi:AbrB family looped-hinge helix DNA binding protein
MNRKDDHSPCCDPNNLSTGCCRVESVVSVDSKGQILLPKEIREKLDIKTNDRLVIVSLGKSDQPSGIVLIKANYLGNMVRTFLGPIMKDLFSDNNNNK